MLQDLPQRPYHILMRQQKLVPWESTWTRPAWLNQSKNTREKSQVQLLQVSTTRISLSLSLCLKRSKRSMTFRVLGSARPWACLTVSSPSSFKSWFQAPAVNVAPTYRSTMHLQPCKSCSVATNGPGSSSFSSAELLQNRLELSVKSLDVAQASSSMYVKSSFVGCFRQASTSK